jgi:hypothetical protein
MKARITTVFATAVVALAVAGGALAAPHQNTIRGWSHGPAGAKTWTVKTWGIRSWDYTRPSASAGWTSYDATGRPLWPIIGFFGLKASDANKPGTVKPWNVRGFTVKPWSVKGWSYKPNPSGIRGGAQAVKGW